MPVVKYRDPDNYKEGPICICLGCGNGCHETLWGKWCFECNVERIDRISKSLNDIKVALETSIITDKVFEKPKVFGDAPKSGDPASVGQLAQTLLDESYELLDSYGLAESILKHWDVRWK